MAVVLQEMVGVDTNDAGLIRLSNISKDDIDHADQHTVLVGVAGVLDDRDNVGALLGHVDQIASRTVRELDGVDKTLGSDNVSNMGYSGSRGGSEVKNLLSGSNVDFINASENASSNLGAEWVPDSVFDLDFVLTLASQSRFVRDSISIRLWRDIEHVAYLNGDPLLAVDRLSRNQVLGQEKVLLAVGDKNSLVSMRLHSDIGTPGTIPCTATASGTTTTTTTTTTATASGAATITTLGDTYGSGHRLCGKSDVINNMLAC